MIVTKLALARRTFLRGLGATMALPLLDAMAPALSALAQTPARPAPRLGFIYLPNGVGMNHAGIDFWTPRMEGGTLELSAILRPLEAFRDRMVVVSGLSHPMAESLGDGNGDHTRSVATWLNGIKPKKTQGADLRAGTTADQIAAERLGTDTVLPSLEMAAVDLDYLVGQCENGYSCTYMSSLAWRSPTTPLPPASSPRVVFEQLFGGGGTRADRAKRLAERRSVLDAATREMGRLQQTLGPTDRARVSEYFDAIREVERRIQAAERQVNASLPTTLAQPPLGVPDTYGDHVSLMFDLQWLAFQADITRVFTFMLGRELNNRTYPEIGVNEPHHAVSHHSDNPDQIAKLTKINTFQSGLFAGFLEKLRSTPDGDGSLLDHVLLLYGAGMSNPNTHSHVNLPLLVAGGGVGRLSGGRHLTYPAGTPMTNLLLGMLDKVGVPIDRLGDSTGRVEALEGL